MIPNTHIPRRLLALTVACALMCPPTVMTLAQEAAEPLDQSVAAGTRTAELPADGQVVGEETPATDQAGQEAPAAGTQTGYDKPADASAGSSVPAVDLPGLDGTAADLDVPAADAPVDDGESGVDGVPAVGDATPADGDAITVDAAADPTADEADAAGEGIEAVYVHADVIGAGEDQLVAVLLGEGSSVLSASLTFMLPDGNSQIIPAVSIAGGSMLFEIDTASMGSGRVSLTDVAWSDAEGSWHQVDLVALGGGSYGFDVEVGDAGISYLTMDDDGGIVECSSLEEAVDEAAATMGALDTPMLLSLADGTDGDYPVTAAAESGQGIIIALDPGHDALRGGAYGYGLKEEDLNLAVALACRDELLTYPGVQVYMTRETADCPFPDNTEGEELKLRVQGAVAAGAQIFVSIHMNSSGPNASGAEVWYPNTGTNAIVGQNGENLAISIQQRLVALGLYDRGAMCNASLDNGEDYYAVIRESKRNGIPGVIIEHAFISSSYDVGTFLSSSQGLRSLGVADATGIANFLGLTKDSPDGNAGNVVCTGNVTVKNLNPATGAYDVVATNVSTSAGVSAVRVEVCTPSGAKGTFQLTRQSDGTTWKAKGDPSILDIRNQTLVVYAAVVDSQGNGYVFAHTDIDSLKVPDSLEVNPDADTSDLCAEMAGSSFANADAVALHVSDGVRSNWYACEKVGDGSWTCRIPVADFGYGDKVAVSAYASVSGATSSVAQTTSTFPRAMPTTVTASWDETAGVMRLLAKGEGIADASNVAFRVIGAGRCSWIAAVNDGSGTWTSDLAPSSFGYGVTIQVAAYSTVAGATDQRGETSATFPAQPAQAETVGKPAVTFDWDEASDAVLVSAEGPSISDSPNVALRVASAGKVSWIAMNHMADGHWEYALPRSEHGDGAAISVEVWSTMNGANDKRVASDYRYPTAPQATIGVEWDDATRIAHITTSGANVTGSPNVALRITGAGKDDWVAMTRMADGSWAFDVSASTYGGGTRVSLEVWSVYGGVTLKRVADTYSFPVADAPTLKAEWDDPSLSARVTTQGDGIVNATNVAFEVVYPQGVKWVQAVKLADGSWTALLPRTDYGATTVKVNAWSTVAGSTASRCSTSYAFPAENPSALSASWRSDELAVRITVKGDVITGSSNVAYRVAAGDKVRWVQCVKNDDGSWYALLKRSDYGAGTKVTVEAWSCIGSDAALKRCAGTYTFPEVASDVVAASYDAGSGAIGIKATGDSVAASTVVAFFISDGISSMWVEGVRNSDGSWDYPLPLSAFAGSELVVQAWSTFSGATALRASTTFSLADVKRDPTAMAGSSFKAVLNGSGTAYDLICSSGGYAIASSVRWIVSGTGMADVTVTATSVAGKWTGTLPLSSLTAPTVTVTAYVTCDGKEYRMDSARLSTALMPIMQPTTVSSQTLAAHYSSIATYPADSYKDKGAADINEFCSILVKEAADEGVDARVLYAQIMLETGYLRFGGDVSIDQCNFGGIGATGNGNPGVTFADVTEGLRAQAQHLKAYATTEPLVNACVDPRFDLVTRGIAPYVQSLSQRWAASNDYGAKLMDILSALH